MWQQFFFFDKARKILGTHFKTWSKVTFYITFLCFKTIDLNLVFAFKLILKGLSNILIKNKSINIVKII